MILAAPRAALWVRRHSATSETSMSRGFVPALVLVGGTTSLPCSDSPLSGGPVGAMAIGFLLFSGRSKSRSEPAVSMHNSSFREGTGPPSAQLLPGNRAAEHNRSVKLSIGSKGAKIDVPDVVKRSHEGVSLPAFPRLLHVFPRETNAAGQPSAPVSHSSFGGAHDLTLNLPVHCAPAVASDPHVGPSSCARQCSTHSSVFPLIHALRHPRGR